MLDGGYGMRRQLRGVWLVATKPGPPTHGTSGSCYCSLCPPDVPHCTCTVTASLACNEASVRLRYVRQSNTEAVTL